MSDLTPLPMVEHALTYAARGWPVFPCDPNDKRPLVPGAEKGPDGKPIKGTGGLYNATTDEAAIRAWWRSRPRAMIGLRCGHAIGAFVLDFDAQIDPETGEFIRAEDLLADLEALLGLPLPETLTSKTPRGGWHMLFRLPDGEEIGNSPGALKAIRRGPAHIDVRGEGGYIIIAPSVRSGQKAREEGCDGVAYRWIDPDAEIAEAPQRLVDALLRRGDFDAQEKAQAPQPLKLNPYDFQAATAVAAAQRKYAQAALDRACAEISALMPGGRNEGINAAAFSIGRLVGAGVLGNSEAYAAISNAAAVLGLPAGDKAFGNQGTIARALEDGAAQPADLSGIGTRAGQARRPERPDPEDEDDDGYGYSHGHSGAHGVYSPDVELGRVHHEAVAADSGHVDGGRIAPPPLPDDGEGEGAPSGHGMAAADPEIIAECARLDTSDTDNAVRMRRHFGADLVVREMDGAAYDPSAWGVWAETHWDFNQGAARSVLLAQKVGDLIGLEAAHLGYLPDERTAIDAAKPFIGGSRKEIEESGATEIVAAAREAERALKKRVARRLSHGVTTKNSGRIESMLKMAAPHLRQPADAFNADRYAVACRTHTLRFRRYRDADIGPDGEARWAAEIVADAGHKREDRITALVPTAWAGADARSEKWLAFMEWALPDAAKRRTVQQFMGLGLLALPTQYVMLHHGTGANGKSVALEALSRVLGPSLAVGLPQESIMGVGDRAAGSASPDIARLWGKRFLRVNELKPGAPLQADLIKRLTGGETFPVRTLFKGYFEFQNVASVHMSSNGKPVIDGGDYGVVRRVLMVHWDQTVPEGQRRDFEEMVSELVAEAPGILAWLAEGVRDFLAHGLVIAPAIEGDTADYARDMDPFGQFCEACMVEAPGSRVQSSEVASAFNAWAAENGHRDKDARQVGKGVKSALAKRPGFKPQERIKEQQGRTFYLDIALENVPARGDRSARPAPVEEF